MKKYLIFICLLPFYSLAQRIPVSGFDTTTGRPGYKYTFKPLYTTSPIYAVNDSTIAIRKATTTDSGYITNTDWNTFNSKEPALGNPGTNGYVLSSTTAGVRSWVVQSGGGGSIGGSNTQIQYNNSGAFAGDAGLTYTTPQNALTVGGYTYSDTIYGSSAAAGNLLLGATSSATPGKIIFYSGSSGEKMRLASNGNFLIGVPTDSTTGKLIVNGVGAFTGGGIFSGNGSPSGWDYTAPGNMTLANTSANSRMDFGQSTSNYAVFIWNYNATPASAYFSIATGGGNANDIKIDGKNLLLMTSNTTGKVGIGVASPAAWLDIKGGSTTVGQFHLSSSTLLTTAAAGTMEYDGSYLYFTRTGTTREYLISTSAVNVVSPTAPNRTITISIGGTTYYIAAKTTND